MKFSSTMIAIKLCLVLYLFPSHILANNFLTISVENQSGDPIENVVISAYIKNTLSDTFVQQKKIKVIDQVDKEFIAHVLPIQLGTAINFPNHDQIRHHVYSFSEAKKFEIPLYEGLPAKPILFDKIGVVSLGCNIHDWMSAYIYVVDTPYFTTSDAKGQATLELPFGEYKIHYWHPNIDKENTTVDQTIKFNTEFKQALSTQLVIKKTWSFRRGPLSGHRLGRYR